ncbi:MAG: RluA family pseudouridine synthase [Fimbriimonadaceae bacterium]|nr:RluA family pseudouridine synthase [Fimbriimonadaceae bacterium]
MEARTFLVTEEGRLDKFLVSVLSGHSRSKLATLIDEARVRVNGKIEKARFVVRPGMTVEVDGEPVAIAHDLNPADIPLDVRFEDEHFLIVNKPRGLAVHPAPSLHEPSLVNALLGRNMELSQAGGDFRPGIVHRLDKETTGLLLVAKSDLVHTRLARQIAAKTAERRYLAIVAGDVTRDQFTINAPIARAKHNRQQMTVDPNGKSAVTHVRKLRPTLLGTLVACRLETGRTHQIRVHLKAMGNPVLGDALYAPKSFATPPMRLHAAYLAVTHPVTGHPIAVFAPPPADFGADATEADLEF